MKLRFPRFPFTLQEHQLILGQHITFLIFHFIKIEEVLQRNIILFGNTQQGSSSFNKGYLRVVDLEFSYRIVNDRLCSRWKVDFPDGYTVTDAHRLATTGQYF